MPKYATAEPTSDASTDPGIEEASTDPTQTKETEEKAKEELTITQQTEPGDESSGMPGPRTKPPDGGSSTG